MWLLGSHIEFNNGESTFDVILSIPRFKRIVSHSAVIDSRVEHRLRTGWLCYIVLQLGPTLSFIIAAICNSRISSSLPSFAPWPEYHAFSERPRITGGLDKTFAMLYLPHLNQSPTEFTNHSMMLYNMCKDCKAYKLIFLIACSFTKFDLDNRPMFQAWFCRTWRWWVHILPIVLTS